MEARLRELEEQLDGLRLDDLGQNEQFVSATLQGTQIALRTHQAEKLQALQNCLLNVAAGTSPQKDQQLIFLHLIGRFSPTHIQVLRYFQSMDQADLARFRQQRDLTDQVVRDLHDSGLLRDTRPYVARNRDMDEALVIYGWEVTNPGKQFLEFIKAPQGENRDHRTHPYPAPSAFQLTLFTPTPNTAKRVLEFFTAQTNNDHTRKAYLNATRRFAEWCAAHGIAELTRAEPFHVAAFIKELQSQFSPPTVKQNLAALRMLFDWLVTGHVLDVNPAHAVRGPKYVVKNGKTPVLTAEEAHDLLESIKLTKKVVRDGRESEKPDLLGLRDRALISVMVYAFARVGAVLQMRVRDYFVQGRGSWVRLHEKNGKEHDVSCHHTLDEYLDEYIAAAGIAGEPDGPLFRTAAGKTGTLTRIAMWQQDTYRMIQRRAHGAGIKTKIGNHSFRATGITVYLKHPNSRLEIAQQLANHESPRTTKLYDRREEELSLDEVEKIGI